MGWMGMVSSVIGSLAWPVTIALLIVAAWKTGALEKLLDRLKKAKGPGGWEFDFGQAEALQLTVERTPQPEVRPSVEAELSQATSPSVPGARGVGRGARVDGSLMEVVWPERRSAEERHMLAAQNPSGLVNLEATDLVFALSAGLRSAGLDPTLFLPADAGTSDVDLGRMMVPIVQTARELGLIRGSDVVGIDYVMRAHRAVVHGYNEPSPSEALSIAQLSGTIQDRIREAVLLGEWAEGDESP